VTPPTSTAMAVGEVACEVIHALRDEPCKLPSRLVSITRQGITVDLQGTGLEGLEGRLGLPLADAWLSAVNPARLDRPSRVYSPDLPRWT